MRQSPVLEPRGSEADGWTATLHDGRSVAIRRIRPQDADAEREFLQRLSPESRRHRFLEQFSTPGDALLAILTRVDQARDAAYVATAQEDGVARIVGGCRFATDAANRSAECAVVVRDDWQGEGLGELMLRLLVGTARQHGLARLYSIDASDNAEMAALARFVGFTRRSDPQEPTQVIHELSL